MSSWRKNGQDLAQTSRKWRKKISNGESDGERKIYPSANPESTSKSKLESEYFSENSSRKFDYMIFILIHVYLHVVGKVRNFPEMVIWDNDPATNFFDQSRNG